MSGLTLGCHRILSEKNAFQMWIQNSFVLWLQKEVICVKICNVFLTFSRTKNGFSFVTEETSSYEKHKERSFFMTYVCPSLPHRQTQHKMVWYVYKVYIETIFFYYRHHNIQNNTFSLISIIIGTWKGLIIHTFCCCCRNRKQHFFQLKHRQKKSGVGIRLNILF